MDRRSEKWDEFRRRGEIEGESRRCSGGVEVGRREEEAEKVGMEREGHV